MKALLPVLAWIVCIVMAVAVVFLVGDATKSVRSDDSDDGGWPMV